MHRLLIVDDEPNILEALRERFGRDGFAVSSATGGREALRILLGDDERPNSAGVDCVVLDLMLPDIDGFEVLRRLRQSGSDVAVIVLTARSDDVDKIVGLELGADDYVAKPFNPRELVARVRALLRRMDEVRLLRSRLVEQAAPDNDPRIDPAQHVATYRGVRLDLRPKEFELLAALAQHRGQVLSRETLLDRVWGSEHFIDPRTVDVHIRRLREKLEAIDPDGAIIETERGVGYRLQPGRSGQ